MENLSLVRLVCARRARFAAVAASSLLVGALGWATAFFVQAVLDRMGQPHILWSAAATLAVVAVLRFALAVLRQRLQLGLAYGVEGELSEEFLRHVGRLEMRAVEQTTPGDLVRRLRGVDYLRTLLEDRAAGIVFDACLALGALLLLILRSPACVPFVVVGAMLPALVSLVARRGSTASFREIQEADGRYTQGTMEAVRGVREVRLLGAEDWMLGRLTKVRTAWTAARRRHVLRAGTAQSLSLLLTTLSGGALLLFGALRRMSPGELMFVLTLAGMLVAPLEQLVSTGVVFSEARVALTRIEEVLRLPAEPRLRGSDVPRGGIRLEGIDFAYRPDRPVLRNLDLEIPEGSTVAIVGESGAGKSTLLALLSGLYVPDAGRILVGGTDLRALPLEAWRRRMGAVFHDPRFFEGTVLENLRLGCESASFEDVRRAARKACAEEFILQHPRKYEAPLLRDGSGFSAGQLQRLALARALAREPELLLLDEATNNLDARTEAGVLGALAEGRTRRTTVFVSHRLASTVRADRIVVLHEGRVAESGTIRDLLERDGLYRRLWHRQLPVNESIGRVLSIPEVRR